MWKFLILMLALATIPARAADSPAVEQTRPYDCGTVGLYYLLEMLGTPRALHSVDACLVGDAVRVHSMKDLRDAAAALGVPLKGVRLARTEEAINSPMLVFVNRGAHGHFLAIRPVGHTGHLAQVLDGDEPPQLLDKADLLASEEWTGLALVPSSPGYADALWWTCATGCAVALAAWPWYRRLGGGRA